MNLRLDYIFIIASLLFLFFFYNEDKKENLKVSLPEEISLAKQGDVLIVEKVSDSIYIGFKHK